MKGKLQRLLLPLDGWVNIYPIRPYIKEWAFSFFFFFSPPQNTVSLSQQLWMALVSLPVWAAILLMHHLAFAGKRLETDTINISGNIPKHCFTAPYILCCHLCLSKINRVVKICHQFKMRTFCAQLALIFHGYKWLIQKTRCDVWELSSFGCVYPNPPRTSQAGERWKATSTHHLPSFTSTWGWI